MSAGGTDWAKAAMVNNSKLNEGKTHVTTRRARRALNFSKCETPFLEFGSSAIMPDSRVAVCSLSLLDADATAKSWYIARPQPHLGRRQELGDRRGLVSNFLSLLEILRRVRDSVERTNSGKRQAKIRVISARGRPITTFEGIARNLMRAIDSLGLYAVGCITCARDKRNRRSAV